MLNKKLLGSVSAAPAEYVEDVFSTYLYTGTGASQTITNDIDLSGKGGLVWIKSRSASGSNGLFDTVRGTSNVLYTDTTNAQSTDNLSAFNSNGFSFTGSSYFTNSSGDTFCSWTFRKAKKFFDVVTYTGNGSARTISHNLDSVPGMIIVKRTDTTGAWQVYHRANTAAPETDYLVLNTTAATADSDTRWNDTLPTSTVFSLGTDATVNANGGTYVAYLFAHDAGGFGTAGTDNVISCGSFVTGSTGVETITLGYEPQYVMFKRADSTSGWIILDTMRGFPNGSVDAYLEANTSAAETTAGYGHPTATGFVINAGFGSGQTYIYMAIRRPMKVPTDATKVFNPVYGQSGAPGFRSSNFNAGVDTSFVFLTSGYNDGTNAYQNIQSRLTGLGQLQTGNTRAEVSQSYNLWDYMNGQNNTTFYDSTWGSWLFKRASGFHDVVCYTGTGSARTIAHNLGVAPEMMIVKGRSVNDDWSVYSQGTGNTDYLILNSTAAKATGASFWNNTSPTSSVFSLGTNGALNSNGGTFVAYLFASCPGVSKVGSYTGNGSSQTIDCGFTNGARFVLIKRTDSTGDWYVWDTVRGIVSGNDPYLLLNTYDAQVTNTDYIDPASSGFEISSTAPAAINANGGSFIFMAIA
jgi:hypothetical protein